MFPVLFQVGPFTLHTYGLLVAIGVFAGIQFAIALARRSGLERKEAEETLYSLSLYFIIGGLIGGRLFYVLFYWKQFAGQWLTALYFWQGGLVSFGGLAGGLAGFWLWQRRHAKQPWPRIADWLAPGIAFGHALGRLGCFFAGCCYGEPSSAPWAVTFSDPQSLAPLGVALHPAQIYEAVFLAALGFYLIWRARSAERQDGQVFAEYLLIYSAGRFALEFFRGDSAFEAFLTSGQVLSLGLFLIGLWLRFYSFNRKFIRTR